LLWTWKCSKNISLFEWRSSPLSPGHACQAGDTYRSLLPISFGVSSVTISLWVTWWGFHLTSWSHNSDVPDVNLYQLCSIKHKCDTTVYSSNYTPLYLQMSQAFCLNASCV
jgi:hypothetical protein